MNPLVIILIGFVAEMGVMVTINLYKFAFKYYNHQG